MRPARVLMNLGRASALAAGPRRRGADREAWNRSRRTLLRAQDAADRTGTSLGEEAVKLEATMNARGRTEQERGIPVGYEPGQTPATDRPDSYFVNDPARQAQVQASELAAGGYDPERQVRAQRAYRDQIATASRGTGAPPVGFGGPQLRQGATLQVEPLAGVAGMTAGQVVPGGALAYEGSGPRTTEAGGTVRLAEGYKTPEQIAADEQAQGAALQQRIAGPYSPEARAAVRAQTEPGMAQARARQLAPPVQGIEDIATGQALTAAGVAGAEAEARGAGALATTLEAQALPAQQMLELWQTPEGKQQVMAMWATASQQQKQAYAAQVLAEVGANLPPEIQQALAEAASGMRVEEYDGSWWQTGGVLGSVWDFLAGIVRGGPTMRRAVPAGTPEPTVAPAAGPSVAAQHSAAMSGGNWSPIANQPAAADQEERELYERLKLKYGG